MITENELNEVQLSATKKDFYQIWQELIDTSKKLSARWDPSTTNESDPGIVLLKVATALSDKLFYNTDKNILEAFMPSAAQLESMRKLCEMMGYTMKYYQSAETDVTIAYTSSDDFATKLAEGDETANALSIPIFTVITDTDNEITYVTTEEKSFTADNLTVTLNCIEGQVAQCETNDNNIISLDMLDDNYRFILPEISIAENGVFVYRLSDEKRSERWTKVDNLNTQNPQTMCYKFGYDSKEERPYIQFPEDVGQLIEDGLEIYYIRTNGVNGNISANTLCTFTTPSTDAWSSFVMNDDEKDFKVANTSAATNGADPETIDEAYNSYKKIIGTFDTLVTCRDYMNAIYNLLDDNKVSYVSNVIVSDIRDDINRSITLCSFNDYGIRYKEQAKVVSSTATATTTDGKTVSIVTEEPRINCFDLVLYPFKTYTTTSKANYENSFTIDNSNNNLIETALEDQKTLSHTWKTPEGTDIVCIKNYLQIDAGITTTTKVSTAEQRSILANIKSALYDTFNMRKLDFGEKIPFDSILECIEDADPRIRRVSLQTPVLITKFLLADGEEYWVGDDSGTTYGAHAYNALVLRNILAGRVELFNYDLSFSYGFNETTYSYTDTTSGETTSYSPVYPENSTYQLVGLTTKAAIPTSGTHELKENEIIKFRAPNFKTTITYPAYVNYYLYLSTSTSSTGVAAEMTQLSSFMATRWSSIMSWDGGDTGITVSNYMKTVTKETDFTNAQEKGYELFTKSGDSYTVATTFTEGTTYYYLPLDENTFVVWIRWLNSLEASSGKAGTAGVYNLYRVYSRSTSLIDGYLIDNGVKYQLVSSWKATSTPLTSLYVNNAVSGNSDNGLGITATGRYIASDTEYELTGGDYLLINYVESTSDDTTSSTSSGITHNIIYKGTDTTKHIIKPNFDLYDSNYLNTQQQKTFVTKLEDNKYDFKKCDDGYTPMDSNPAGLYCLGTSEQIELREQVCVDFGSGLTGTNSKTILLYWSLNYDGENEAETPDDVIAANIRDLGSRLNIPSGSLKGTYELKDGEYLYYTDTNKLDMAYYGSGTELVFTNPASWRSALVLDETDDTEDAAEVLTMGISAIPWKIYQVQKYDADSNPTGKDLIINEYQYIILAAGDTLQSITMTDNTDNDTTNDVTTLTNTWQSCSAASYIMSGTSGSLPTLSVTDAQWQVRSILQLNVGPDTAQTLYNTYDSITLTKKIGVQETTGTIIQPADSAVPLTFKTNYTVQRVTGVDGKIDTHITKYVDDVKEVLNDFKLRIIKTEDLTTGDTTDTKVDLHNASNNLTKVAAKNIGDDGMKLYVTIPDANHYGIMMIYYTGENTTLTKNMYLTTSAGTPVIFNYRPGTATFPDETWWTNGSNEAEKKYYLRPGINIIRFNYTTSGYITIFKASNESADAEVITFSDIDIITMSNGTNADSDQGLNMSLLQYQAIDELSLSAAKQLLLDINEADPDHNFYYNCPMDNSTKLDINTNTDETLADPEIWYEYNNINNKFVISEIDTTYLADGLRIESPSKA